MAHKYSEEIEKSILGLFLNDPKLFKIHSGSLKDTDFFIRKHQLIFKAIYQLNSKDYNIDLILLGNLFESKGRLTELGGRSYLVEVASTMAMPSAINNYIKELKKLSKRRKEHDTTTRLSKAIDDGNEENILSLKEELINIEQDFVEIKPEELTAWMPEFEKEYFNPQEGINTPFPSLNKATTGFKRGELVSLAGLSGSGKSLLALQFSIEAVKKNFKTLYFSLEMSPNQMIPRFLSMVLDLDINKIKYKEADYERDIKSKMFTLDQRPIKFVFDLVSTSQIFSISYLEKIKHGLDFIIVDYFSLLQDGGWKTEIEKEKEVIGRLKGIAKKLNVVLLVPLALSKDVAKKTKTRQATAEDTIGSIHQTYTVDIGLALNRQRLSQTGTFSITKNRSGDYANFPVLFDRRTLMFSEVTKMEEPLDLTGGEQIDKINF